MPTVVLTKVAGTVSLSSEWVTIEDDGRVNIQHAVAPELAGPGIEITKIQITCRARNSSSAVKNLRLGFKPALSSNRNTWAAYQGSDVLDSTFQAIGGSSNGSYIYKTTTRTYDAATNSAAFAKFAGHIRESFINGNPVYLGIIQPTSGRSTQIYVSGYWTITVTYDILGNIPTTNVGEAVIGSTSITTTIEKVVPGSVTKLRYKVGDVGVPSPISTCPCGCNYPIMESLEGRVADYVVTPDGKYISGISLTENFAMHLPGVKQMQIFQEKTDFLVFRIVKGESFSDQTIMDIDLLARARFGTQMNWQVEYVTSIQSELSGKYRFCISKIENPFS